MALSAAELGRRILGEVEGCGFAEVLQSLKGAHPGDAHKFGMPPLDRLVEVFQQPPAAQGAPVVEIGSSRPSEGGTAFIYAAIATAVLPLRPPDGCSAGHGGAAVLIDADGRFNVERLQQAMHSRLRPSKTAETPESKNMDDAVLYAMSHVLVLRPQSMSALVETLQSLPGQLLSLDQASRNRTLALLAIDSISAFSWQDRADEEVLRYNQSSGEDTTPYTPNKEWTALVAALRELQERFHMPILATSWGLSPTFSTASSTRPGAPAVSYRSHIPGGWNGLVTVRLVMERESVRQFAAGMSLETAERERAMRADVVVQGKWTMRVDLWGAQEWSERLLQALKALGRSFDVWVTRDGVTIGGE